MKKILYLVLVFALYCFAQTSSDSAPKSSSSAADSQISCPEIEYHGMQTTKHIPNKPYIINWDRNTIDLEGIVDYVGSDTFFVDGIIPILFADSTKIAAKLIKLRQVTISSTDNSMKTAFDSNFVYIPLIFNTNKGDTISANNYSASIFLDCSSPYIVPYAFFMGDFSVNSPSNVTAIKPIHHKQNNISVKAHNRNASGRFLNRKPSKIIQY